MIFIKINMTCIDFFFILNSDFLSITKKNNFIMNHEITKNISNFTKRHQETCALNCVFGVSKWWNIIVFLCKFNFYCLSTITNKHARVREHKHTHKYLNTKRNTYKITLTHARAHARTHTQTHTRALILIHKYSGLTYQS